VHRRTLSCALVRCALVLSVAGGRTSFDHAAKAPTSVLSPETIVLPHQAAGASRTSAPVCHIRRMFKLAYPTKFRGNFRTKYAAQTLLSPSTVSKGRFWNIVLHRHDDASLTARVWVDGKLLRPDCVSQPAAPALAYLDAALLDVREGDPLTLRAQGSGGIRTLRAQTRLLLSFGWPSVSRPTSPPQRIRWRSPPRARRPAPGQSHRVPAPP
jgi:hypothetical protein